MIEHVQAPLLTCPLCSRSTNFEPIFSGSHNLFRCVGCGMIFSERIMDPHIFDYYQENHESFYESAYFREALDDISSNPDFPNYREALGFVHDQIGHERPRLLDVGCGTGFLLTVADRLGFESEGLEVSPRISERVSNRFKIHLYDGSVKNLPSMEPFDVIVLWDVLEHLPRPFEFLRSLRPYLNPGGRLLIRTINEDCLLAQVSLLAYRLSGRKIKGPAERMHVVSHVVYFTQRTLLETVKKGGYEPVRHWLGEFPVERASTSRLTRATLRVAYVLQKLLRKTYEQYLIARPA